MSNLITQNSTEKTMSSVQLTEIINEYRRKEDNKSILIHTHLLQKIEKELNGEETIFRSTYLDKANRKSKCYNLPKDECILMLMSESRTVRKGVLERLNKLESQKNELPEIPSNFSEALLLAYNQQKVIEKLTPRSLYFEKMITTDGLVSMQEVAKLLNIQDMGRNKMFEKLRVGNIIMKNSTAPYQHFVNKGYFELKEEIVILKEDVRKVNITTYATQKGLAFIFKFFGLTKQK